LLFLVILLISGCCTPRSGCNDKPDPTAAYQVKPAEYQRAMREGARAKATQEATRPASTSRDSAADRAPPIRR